MTSQTAKSFFGHRYRPGIYTVGISFCIALAMVVLSACGSGGAANPGSSTGHSALTMVPSPTGSFSENFNPFLTNGTGNLFGTDGPIYETLYFFNREDGSTVPMLATSYQYSSDATSITFNLRSGVKWSDGTAFSSQDVLFTFNLMHQYAALDQNGLWNSIQSVSAPDASTFVVKLKQASSPILWYIAGQTYIVPQHVWQSVSDPTKYTNTNPVGTGPFVLESFAAQIYKLKKNPTYWQPGLPKVDEVDFPAYDSNNSAELALTKGTLDWDGQFLPNIQGTYVSKDPSHYHYWFPPHQVTMLYLNLTKFPFNILAVRQAMSIAIDRQQIGTLAESGYQVPASPTGLILPSNQTYLDPQYSSLSYSVDTAKATSLLESAGFTKGSDGIYAKGGQKLSFNLIVPTGWTDWDTACQLIQSELKSIGISVNVNQTTVSAYIDAMQKGTFDTAMSWTNPGPTPYYLYNSMLNGAYTAPVGQTAASNWDRWNDPTTNQLLKQFAGTTDDATQKQAIQGLEKIMVEQVPAIPLVYGSTWYESNSARFVGWPDTNHPYAVPAPYEAPDAEIVLLHLSPA